MLFIACNFFEHKNAYSANDSNANKESDLEKSTQLSLKDSIINATTNNNEENDTLSTTKIPLDWRYTLLVKTKASLNSDTLTKEFAGLRPIISQMLYFLDGEHVIGELNTHSIGQLKSKHFQQPYRLTEVGVDSISDNKFYALYFYLANGEPEFYLYYNMKGELLFFQKCDKEKCSTRVVNFNKINVKHYIDKNSTIKFIDILGSL